MRRFCLLYIGFLASCGPPSIDQFCEDVSVVQCTTCYSCQIDGATACDLAPGTDAETCETEMAARCVDQAATLERPKRALDDCNESLSDLTCDMLIRSAAQDSPHTTDECAYFL